MAKTLKHFDAALVAITFGPLLLEGTAEGGRLTIEFPDGYGHVVGTDAEVARFKINDETALATVPLLQTSLTNDLLTQLYQQDRNAPGGVPLPFFAKDLNGTSIFVAPGAWIVGLPQVTYVQGIEAREWKFQCASGLWTIGGNANLTA